MDTFAVANLILDVASIINFIALLWMLRAILKNRNYLRGFSVVGSFLTFVSIIITSILIAVTGFEVAYYLLGNIIGFAISWATVAFWFLAFVYTLKQKLKGTKTQKEMVEA